MRGLEALGVWIKFWPPVEEVPVLPVFKLDAPPEVPPLAALAVAPPPGLASGIDWNPL